MMTYYILVFMIGFEAGGLTVCGLQGNRKAVSYFFSALLFCVIALALVV